MEKVLNFIKKHLKTGIHTVAYFVMLFAILSTGVIVNEQPIASGSFVAGPDIEVSSDFNIAYAEKVIEDTYGDVVSVNDKKKGLVKFGRNQNVGSASTGYTIWYTGQDRANETYVADNVNSIDSVSSGSTSDTMQVTVEGHTMANGDRTFVIQTATLEGRTRVALGTPLNRMTRMYVSSGTTTNAGELYGYQNTSLTNGKPTDTTKIHITVPTGKNQSEKASTALSSRDYWIVTGFRGSVLEKASAAFADVELQVRRVGGVWRPLDDISATSDATGARKPVPYFIIPPNSDVRLVAISDSSSRDISGSIEGYLAIIK